MVPGGFEVGKCPQRPKNINYQSPVTFKDEYRLCEIMQKQMVFQRFLRMRLICPLHGLPTEVSPKTMKNGVQIKGK